MQAVPERMWMATLNRLANLRMIALKDMPHAPDGSLDAFFAALSSVSNPNLPVHQQRPVCPPLVTLTICTRIEGTGLVQTIKRCLEWRTQNGAMPLGQLELQLYPDHRLDRFEKAIWEDSLTPLVHTYMVHLHNLKDRQGQRMPDAEDWNKVLSAAVNMKATMRRAG
ncbi:hypothetical protein TRAPUB_11637 [Trametes pubescens]|uniref:Uncharacterized protein n=1 Tax=Trametes pubescens TaxID=154538 RepID=A0A1M2VWD3_TRAPU|nr:hypothetical protein TRAPUB_11637 [Trametes pubescens]